MISYDKEDGVLTVKNTFEGSEGCGCLFLMVFVGIFAFGGLAKIVYLIFNKQPILTEWQDYFELLFIPVFFYLFYHSIVGFREKTVNANLLKIDIQTQNAAFIQNGKDAKIIEFVKGSFYEMTILVILNPAPPYSDSTDLIYTKIEIQGDEILFFLCKEYGWKDIYYYRRIAEYLQIPCSEKEITMIDDEYKEFKKQEIEDIQNDTRQKYYL